MKKWMLKLFVVCAVLIIIGSLLFVQYKKKYENINWDIKIYEHWNDPLAGKRHYSAQCLLINTNLHIGKLSYLEDNVSGTKESKVFKIREDSITQLIDVIENGTYEMPAHDLKYLIYEIDINNERKYVDATNDVENVITSLFRQLNHN